MNSGKQTAHIRKKPCPYCQKKLVATTKGKWRYNLARHLANACQPYQRENISMMTQFAWKMLEGFLPGGMTRPSIGSVPDYLKALNARAEICELERIAKMDAPTRNPVCNGVEPLDSGEANKKQN